MARKAKFDSETLISLFDQYYMEKCHEKSYCIKISDFGSYMRSKGFEIQDYTIRRNESLMNRVNDFKEKPEEVHLKSVSFFRDTNIEQFLTLNNTKEKLSAAITEKDNYYRSLSESASYFFKKNKEVEDENRSLSQKMLLFEEENKELKAEIDRLSKENRAYKTENKQLRGIIDTYVYPEIANELLKKQGLLKTTAKIADIEAIEANLVSATDDISNLKNNVVKDLFRLL